MYLFKQFVSSSSAEVFFLIAKWRQSEYWPIANLPQSSDQKSPSAASELAIEKSIAWQASIASNGKPCVQYIHHGP